MAVAFDAQSTASTTANSVTTHDHNNLTVGTGSNRALVVIVCLSSTDITPTVTWDQGGTNQACTQITGAQNTATNRLVKLFGLVAPTSGNKTLRVSWTGARDVYVAAVAVTGANQTGGTTTFPNGTSSLTASALSNTVTVTSAVGDYVVAGHVTNGSNNVSSVNNTQVFINNTASTIGGGGNRAVGAATVGLSVTAGGNNAWGSAGTSIKADGGAGTQAITGALVTDADTFFGATVDRGAVDIGGALFANSNTFFASTVSATYAVTGALYTDADTFYGATITTGSVDIGGALFADADSFFAATIGRGAVDIAGALFADGDTFYGSTVSASYPIAGALYSDADTFFGATITVGISGSLVVDADTFFAATVVADGSPQSITGALYSDPDTFFAAAIVAEGGDQSITGALYANDNTFFGASLGGVIPFIITPGGGNIGRRKWRWWEDAEPEVRKIAKAEVVTAIQQGLLVELTRAGVKAYAAQTVERLVPEISDEALNEITARITASMHRVIAQQRQEEDDAEAMLLSA